MLAPTDPAFKQRPPGAAEGFDLVVWLERQAARWPVLLATAVVGALLGAAGGWLSALSTKGEVLIQFAFIGPQGNTSVVLDLGRQAQERLVNRPFVEAALRADPSGRGEAWIAQLPNYEMDAAHVTNTNLVRLKVSGDDPDMVRYLCEALPARLVAEQRIAYDRARSEVERTLARIDARLREPAPPRPPEGRDAALAALSRDAAEAEKARLYPFYADTMARLNGGASWSEPKVLDGTWIKPRRPAQRSARAALAGLLVGIALAAMTGRKRS